MILSDEERRKRHRKYQLAWINRDPERNKENQRKHNRKLRLEVINHYGAKCACCGESNERFLAIDHINGGGTRHRKSLGLTGAQFYRWIKRNGFPEDLRVLCHNCNLARGYYGVCHDLIQ